MLDSVGSKMMHSLDINSRRMSGTVSGRDRNSVLVSVTAPKLAIFLVSVTAVIVKHGFVIRDSCRNREARFRLRLKL